MPYYFYILRCSDNSLYSGVTNDLQRRVEEHNSGLSRSAKYTRSRKPVQLIYHEQYEDKPTAMKREAAVKKLSKIKKEELVKKPF